MSKLSKTKMTTLFVLSALLFLSACGETQNKANLTNKSLADIREYERKTLEQAKALEESFKGSFDHKVGSLN